MSFKFWLWCGSKSGYVYEFDMYLGNKTKTKFGFGELVVLSFFKRLRNSYCYLFFYNAFEVPKLMFKLLENRIYEIGKIKSNQKCMLFLKAHKQMMHGEDDLKICASFSAKKIDGQ